MRHFLDANSGTPAPPARPAPRVWRILASTLAAAIVPGAAFADEPSIAPVPAERRQTKEEQSFDRGMELFVEKKYGDALDQFLRSRAEKETGGNTMNAGLCLVKLGRLDEALDLFDLAVARYNESLTPKNHRYILDEIRRLSLEVGTISLDINVDGFEVEIDGRLRRDLIDRRRVRVLPGEHEIGLSKNGFSPLSKRIVVDRGARTKLAMKLSPLGAWIRVEDEDSAMVGAAVFVDGGAVGATPWEGQVGRGAHVVWIQKGQVGSGPTSVVAADGETRLLRVRSRRLGPAVRIEAQPSTAVLSLGEVRLGQGIWLGYLPIGAYTIVAAETGYRSKELSLDLRADRSVPVIHLSLEKDPAHPRWASERRGNYWMGAFGGFAIGSSFGSTAEATCLSSCARLPPTGVLAGARAGYRFSFGLSLEFGVGVVSLGTSFSRRLQSRFGPSPGPYTATYELNDDLRFAGPLIAAGVSQRFALGSRVELFGRIAAGAAFVSSADLLHGTVAGGGQRLPVSLTGSITALRSADPLLLPEVGVNVRFGALAVGGALTFGALMADGPSFERGSLTQDPTSCPDRNPGAAACARDSDLVKSERAYGRFVIFSPQIAAAYVFP